MKIKPSLKLLKRYFYERPTVEVAYDLIGKLLVRMWHGTMLSGFITETEAYCGLADPASHAFKGKTPRNQAMFGPAGHSYVYFIYGNHYCLNVVAKEKDVPAGGVLIRGLAPYTGVPEMQKARNMADTKNLTNGPGKIGQALHLHLSDNHLDVTQKNGLYVTEGIHVPAENIIATPRIGISKSQDKLWRFVVNNATLLLIILSCSAQSLGTTPLAEQFQQWGYAELSHKNNDATTFERLYAAFDELVVCCQTHPALAHKLCAAKERFIRSKIQQYYGTDFFGFYDESQRPVRNQVSFYYSTHFHDFICTHFPELKKIPVLMQFLDLCHEVQQPYQQVFKSAAAELGLVTLWPTDVPILFKVVKYLPGYSVSKPHYDGTALSIFAHSTDNASLRIAAYTNPLTVDDFFCPTRNNQNSILLVPGTLLAEHAIWPTPHIVLPSRSIRYATIAFAMRPEYVAAKIAFADLPQVTS